MGRATARIPTPSQRNAARQPSEPMRVAMTGTSTNWPAADPAPTIPRASPRRAVNQRATATAEVGLDAPPMPSMMRTPKIAYACQSVTIELTAIVPTPRIAMLVAKMTRGPVAIGPAPGEGLGQPVDDEAERGGEAHGRPIPAELGFPGVDEKSNRAAHAQRDGLGEEHHADHDPRVRRFPLSLFGHTISSRHPGLFP